jgi:hypothetical protein
LHAFVSTGMLSVKNSYVLDKRCLDQSEGEGERETERVRARESAREGEVERETASQTK